MVASATVEVVVVVGDHHGADEREAHLVSEVASFLLLDHAKQVCRSVPGLVLAFTSPWCVLVCMMVAAGTDGRVVG